MAAEKVVIDCSHVIEYILPSSQKNFEAAEALLQRMSLGKVIGVVPARNSRGQFKRKASTKRPRAK